MPQVVVPALTVRCLWFVKEGSRYRERCGKVLRVPEDAFPDSRPCFQKGAKS